jgi:hypothetical protein
MSTNKPAHVRRWIRMAQAPIASGFDRVLIYEFDLLEEHRAFTDRHFTSSAKQFEAQYQADLAEIDEGDRAHFAEHMIDEYTNMVESFPRLQWYAQFLVVYATFEHGMNELCKIVKNRSNFSLAFTDIKDLGITRAANYLRKVADVHSPFTTAAWNRALLLGEIRNVITHRNGQIDIDLANKKSLAFRIKGLSGLTLKQLVKEQEDAEIILNAEFVREAIADLRKVLRDVANYELYKDES